MICVDDRFLAKVQQKGECWVWTASLTGAGYAQFWNGERIEMGHRFSYRQFIGPIPEGLELDHLCRNTRCVNPDHLEPVTRKENLARGRNWAREKTTCPRGHRYDRWGHWLSTGNRARRCSTCDGKKAQW